MSYIITDKFRKEKALLDYWDKFSKTFAILGIKIMAKLSGVTQWAKSKIDLEV